MLCLSEKAIGGGGGGGGGVQTSLTYSPDPLINAHYVRYHTVSCFSVSLSSLSLESFCVVLTLILRMLEGSLCQ